MSRSTISKMLGILDLNYWQKFNISTKIIKLISKLLNTIFKFDLVSIKAKLNEIKILVYINKLTPADKVII